MFIVTPFFENLEKEIRQKTKTAHNPATYFLVQRDFSSSLHILVSYFRYLLKKKKIRSRHMPLLISLYYLLLLTESFRPEALVSKYGIDQSNVSENSPSEVNQNLFFTLFTSLLSVSLVKWSPFLES